MTNIERVWDAIKRHPGKDDDKLSLILNIHPRQQVNQICRKLEKHGQVVREMGRSGQIVNKAR
jgi:hypothetical protein